MVSGKAYGINQIRQFLWLRKKFGKKSLETHKPRICPQIHIFKSDFLAILL